MTVLVGYSSKYGATAGIAERIATTLTEAGTPAEARPLAEVDDPAGYDAFVLGASAYLGSWRKDATRFVRRHHELLAGRPVWLFSSGPLGTDTTDAEGRDMLTQAVPKQFAEFTESLHPRGTQVFYGAMDTSKLRGRDSLVGKMPAVEKILPNGDFRDWPAIDAWAKDISREL
jgi:menaquinone-dependent protoporphyrinogen oxidase